MGDDVKKVPYLSLKEREENLKEALRNGGFIGDNGTWNSIIMFSGDKHVYRHRVETLVIKDLSEVFVRFDSDGKYHIPAGSIEKDLPFSTQALNECQEEAQINVRNIEHTGITYKQVVPIPDTVKPTDNHGIQWNGNYNEVFIGDYDGPYRGKIDDVDKDPFMAKGKFVPIKDIYSKLIPEHKTAIMNYLRMRQSSEFTEKSEFDSYYTSKRINFFDDVFEMSSYHSFFESCENQSMSSDRFYTSIHEAIQNCSEKDIGCFILISEANESLSGKIRSINKMDGEVLTSEDIPTKPIKLVKMIDDVNYADVTPERDENLVMLYHPTADEDGMEHELNHQNFWENYEDAYNYAIYLAIKKELPKIHAQYHQVGRNCIQWSEELNKILCGSPIDFSLIKRYLQHTSLRAYLHMLKIRKSDIVGNEIKNYDTDFNYVLSSFLVTPDILETAMHVLENPINAKLKSNTMKYCIVNDATLPIRVYNHPRQMILEYIRRNPNCSMDRPITVASSEFFDKRYYDSMDEIDGCPSKIISCPLQNLVKKYCKEDKEKIPTPTMESGEMNYRKTIDLESTMIIGYLSSIYKYFSELYDHLEKVYKEFIHTDNQDDKAAKDIDKIDKILKNVEEVVSNGYPLYISSCNKIIRTYYEDPKAFEFSRLNFNSIYNKYSKLYKKYDSLLDKVDIESLSVIRLEPKDSPNSKVRFNRLTYRVSDAFGIVGKIYLKLDSVMNPDEKVDKDG